MMDKDLRKLLSALEDAGYLVVRTRGGHFAVYSGEEDPAERRWVTTFAGTGSDWRGVRNALGPLRRLGFHWPPKR